MLFHHQLVRVFIVLHDLVILHVVVGDGLSAKHNQGILVNHVKSHEPNTPVDDCVEHDPRVTLDVQLLDGGPVAPGLVTNGVDVPMAESAAIRSSNRLLQARERLLLHG